MFTLGSITGICSVAVYTCQNTLYLKNATLLYFEYLGEKKTTDFNNFWFTKSRGNFASENCKTAHVT